MKTLKYLMLCSSLFAFGTAPVVNASDFKEVYKVASEHENMDGAEMHDEDAEAAPAKKEVAKKPAKKAKKVAKHKKKAKAKKAANHS